MSVKSSASKKTSASGEAARDFEVNVVIQMTNLAQALGMNADRLAEILTESRALARTEPEMLPAASESFSVGQPGEPPAPIEADHSTADPLQQSEKPRRKPGLLAGKIFPGLELLDPTDEDEIKAWHGE